MTREQVRAISHLVSSAVEGLSPDNLTVVDMNGNVLADGASSQSAAAIAQTQSQLDAQYAFEHDLELRIQSMLKTFWDRKKQSCAYLLTWIGNKSQLNEKRMHPENKGGVIRSSHQITETYSGSGGAYGGIPGTASNIPDETSSYQLRSILPGKATITNGTDTTINYEVSHSVSQIVSPPEK